MTESVEDLAAWLTAVWDEEAEGADGIHELGCELARPTPFPCTCAYPASVLARIAADRSILARYQRACLRADDPSEDEQVRYEWGVIASTYEEVLCELASVHQDRDGFRSEWLVERQGVEQ